MALYFNMNDAKKRRGLTVTGWSILLSLVFHSVVLVSKLSFFPHVDPNDQAFKSSEPIEIAELPPSERQRVKRIPVEP